MIYLELNTVNPVSVDAPQTITIATPFYYFVFENIQTKRDYKGYVTRENLSSQRFGLFSIDIPTEFNIPAGEYEYSIYENANSTDTDETLMNRLEIGKAKVLGTSKTVNVYQAPELIANVYAKS